MCNTVPVSFSGPPTGLVLPGWHYELSHCRFLGTTVCPIHLCPSWTLNSRQQGIFIGDVQYSLSRASRGQGKMLGVHAGRTGLIKLFTKSRTFQNHPLCSQGSLDSRWAAASLVVLEHCGDSGGQVSSPSPGKVRVKMSGVPLVEKTAYTRGF